MEFKTKNGKVLEIDTDKWLFSENLTCTIVAQDELYYDLINDNGIIFKIPIEIININELQVVDNKVTLTKGLYDYYLTKPVRARSLKRFNELFEENAQLIFRNKHILLSRAEYFVLKPKMLVSGSSISGGVDYCLGSVIESFDSGEHIYFDEFDGHKKMYLISVGGSLFSGIQTKQFWCEEEQNIIFYPIGEGPRLPNSLGSNLSRLSKLLGGQFCKSIDFQDRALEQLINEING